ncbi:helix-turn-helix transcriptional regulator [Actinomyces succiniciruminis]|uniref:Lambda repressor-like, DNA-binding domain n=1 Tax=Actinomyces succiniciruminis TaxID=1522002 RepID=A0A1L7RM93_9ACTO|nr:hypothetical protein [Actinomyces succiniciruminis]CED91310.1 Lambda repressor-like, DNA-binding domain [Actinomyces succiniciruminis]
MADTEENDTAPGQYLWDWIESDMARRLELKPELILDLINGEVEVTPDLARRLEEVTGTPTQVWLAREAAHRQSMEELMRRALTESHE